METFLKGQETVFKREHPSYTDIKASYLAAPSEQYLEKCKCSHGCDLEILEPWRAIEGKLETETEKQRDLLRQSCSCEVHGYARIFVTTGLDAAHAGYLINTL